MFCWYSVENIWYGVENIWYYIHASYSRTLLLTWCTCIMFSHPTVNMVLCMHLLTCIIFSHPTAHTAARPEQDARDVCRERGEAQRPDARALQSRPQWRVPRPWARGGERVRWGMYMCVHVCMYVCIYAHIEYRDAEPEERRASPIRYIYVCIYM